MTKAVLFLSNGHGEDAIAGRLIDALQAQGLPRAQMAGWAMVGHGAAYETRGITRIGPANLLPSEGFGTLGLRPFLRDLRAGWIGTHRAQARFARALRGQYRLLVAVGDVVPLLATHLARTPTAFVSCAKSAYYDGRTGHTAPERWLMRRATAVFPRDALTADRLRAAGVANQAVGNPMMDGLTPTAAGWFCEPGQFREQGRLGLLMLPGSRGDATANAMALLMAVQGAAEGRFVALFACTGAVDLAAISHEASAGRLGGWRASGLPVAEARWLDLSHFAGGRAILARDVFPEMLMAAEFAIGMAGTANEQAMGHGLPLIVVPGRGNQGVSYMRMKRAFYGPAAIEVSRIETDLAPALDALLGDPERQAMMRAEGRARMGGPGASAAIATVILGLMEGARNG